MRASGRGGSEAAVKASATLGIVIISNAGSLFVAFNDCVAMQHQIVCVGVGLPKVGGLQSCDASWGRL